MSRENVEVAGRAYAALKAGALDEFISYFDPEIEFSSRVLELEGTFRGLEGVREW
jgi:hypothetical protein